MKKWKQPDWFWWTVGLFSLAEIGFYTLLYFLGISPKSLIESALIIGLIIYPIFLFLTLLFLEKQLRKDVDTLFYLAVPLMINLPFWSVFPEVLRGVVERFY